MPALPGPAAEEAADMQEGNDAAAPEPTAEHLQVLQSIFRVTGFRGRQYEAIHATLSGRDSFVILPTGAGKSLTFQFPPCAVSRGFTVVVGPLLALMREQVQKGRALGMHVGVYNSDQTWQDKQRTLDELRNPDTTLDLLYTTPESLYGKANDNTTTVEQRTALFEALQDAYRNGCILSFAIDEAHCICDWGPSFRPTYLKLGNLKSDFPGVAISALSATTIRHLHLDDPVIINASFNRPNIQYRVHLIDVVWQSGGHLKHLLDFVQDRQGEAGIIYCNKRVECDLVGLRLASRHINAEVIHAGKGMDERERIQDAWVAGGCNLVVATTAFGMGIDRSDVRWVVHYTAPFSMERYMQESGRAGRDGQPCLHVVYVCPKELRDCGEWAKKRLEVKQVAALCLSRKCRRVTLLQHFGEIRDPCGIDPDEQLCDVCQRNRLVAASRPAAQPPATSQKASGAEPGPSSIPATPRRGPSPMARAVSPRATMHASQTSPAGPTQESKVSQPESKVRVDESKVPPQPPKESKGPVTSAQLVCSGCNDAAAPGSMVLMQTPGLADTGAAQQPPTATAGVQQQPGPVASTALPDPAISAQRIDPSTPPQADQQQATADTQEQPDPATAGTQPLLDTAMVTDLSDLATSGPRSDLATSTPRSALATLKKAEPAAVKAAAQAQQARQKTAERELQHGVERDEQPDYPCAVPTPVKLEVKVVCRSPNPACRGAEPPLVTPDRAARAAESPGAPKKRKAEAEEEGVDGCEEITPRAPRPRLLSFEGV